MGGDAFKTAKDGQPAVETPRMSPEVYHALKAVYQNKLEQHYNNVCVPVEAPWKESYGDLDFLVESSKADVKLSVVARNLMPVRLEKANVNQCSIAVPQIASSDTYAQVDIRECQSGFLEWQAFHEAYGDMWSILGAVIRYHGLTVNDKGLHLRIKGGEDATAVEGNAALISEKECLVLLSKEPDKVMQYLGLSSEKYNTGFQTEEELFTWIAHSALACREAIEYPRMIATDRQRYKKRPMFSRFMLEWAPEHLRVADDDLPPAQPSTQLRRENNSDFPDVVSKPADSHAKGEQIEDTPVMASTQSTEELTDTDRSKAKKDDAQLKTRESALSFFDKKAVFDQKLAVIVQKREDSEAKKIIVGILSACGVSEKGMKEAIRSLRRWVAADDKGLHLLPLGGPSDLQTSNLAMLLKTKDSVNEKALEWIKANWETARHLERNFKK